jgi:hypothetical protein
MADAPTIGPWRVLLGRTYSGTNFHKLMRKNSAWSGGLETLLTPKGHIKRFHDKAKAEKEAARLNDATRTPQDGAGVPERVTSPSGEGNADVGMGKP